VDKTTHENGIDPCDAFRAVGLLDGSDEAAADLMVDALHPRLHRFIDGDMICRSGEPADRLWILASGRVCVSEEAFGRPNNIVLREAPCFLGELGIIRDQGARTATMTALGRVDAFEIPAECIRSLCDPDSKAQLWRSLARAVAEKLAESVPARAEQQAVAIETEKLLRRFVNPYALASTRTELRTDYTAETVAVMFTDVIGFSDIAAQVSPDEIADLIKAVLSAQTAAIQAEEGEVDKFIGDAIMAYWIVSGSRKVDLENAAGRALRAARQALHAAANIQSPLDGAPSGCA
jgi:CRP-like cAMP-binding protein